MVKSIRFVGQLKTLSINPERGKTRLVIETTDSLDIDVFDNNSLLDIKITESQTELSEYA